MNPATINWSGIGTALAAIAGAVGVVVSAIWGADAGSNVQKILLGVSGVLLAIPTWHVASVAAAKAKFNHLARMAALAPPSPHPVPVASLDELHTLT